MGAYDGAGACDGGVHVSGGRGGRLGGRPGLGGEPSLERVGLPGTGSYPARLGLFHRWADGEDGVSY